MYVECVIHTYLQEQNMKTHKYGWIKHHLESTYYRPEQHLNPVATLGIPVWWQQQHNNNIQ